MILKVLALGLAMGLVAPGAALAERQVYHCKLSVSRTNNWVPKEIYISYDTVRGEVRVADPIVQHYVGKPVPGEVIVNNSRRVTFGWDLKSAQVDASNYLRAMKYRATIQKSNLAVAISATPVGYSNHFRGAGGCVRQ